MVLKTKLSENIYQNYTNIFHAILSLKDFIVTILAADNINVCTGGTT